MLAPPGALLAAQNCVIRAPGVLSPVPDVETIDQASSNTGAPIAQSDYFANAADQAVFIYDGGGGNDGLFRGTDLNTELTYYGWDQDSTKSIGYFANNADPVPNPMHETKKHLYIGDQLGNYSWDTGDVDLLRSIVDGIAVITNEAINTGTSNDWLPHNSHVGYRFVVRTKSRNGLITRSAPTPVIEIDNTTGASGAVDFSAFIPYALGQNGATSVAGANSVIDAVEIYRTRTFNDAVAIPNEYYLVAELPFTQATVSIPQNYSWGTYTDLISSDDLGRALYTNTSQEGEEGANFAPPEHRYHAEYRDTQFWGNVAEKEFFPPLNFTYDPYTTTLWYRDVTGATITVGTNTITGVVALLGAEVGMVVAEGGFFPSGTYITAISGAGPFTLTVSENATASGTPATLRIQDSVYILWGDGTEYRAGVHDARNVTTLNLGSTGLSEGGYVAFASGSFLGTDNRYAQQNIYSNVYRTARLGGAQMWVSNPELYEGTDWADLNTGTGAPTTGGTPAFPAVFPYRVYFSKLQEPEHTTLGNFFDFPSEVVGMGALDNALVVLTRDGAYRVTGINGQWRQDPIDTSNPVIGGRSTKVMDNAVYTLGARGLLRVTASQVENLSDDIATDWFNSGTADGGYYPAASRLEGVMLYRAEQDVFGDDGVYGTLPTTLFAGADPQLREYWLRAEAEEPDSEWRSEFLVFNANTNAFTTYLPTFPGTISDGILSMAYAPYNYNASFAQSLTPGLTLGVQAAFDAARRAALQMHDNTTAPILQDQDIRFRAIHVGDPTHIKLWTAIVWDVDETNIQALGNAVFQDGELGPQVVQALNDITGEEIRVWPPLDVVRSTKLVAGLQGAGIVLYAMRATYASSGRESPL